MVQIEPANSDPVTSPNSMSGVPDMPSREVRLSSTCSGLSMMRATSRRSAVSTAMRPSGEMAKPSAILAGTMMASPRNSATILSLGWK